MAPAAVDLLSRFREGVGTHGIPILSGRTVHLVLGSHVSVNSHQEADGALSSLPSSPSPQ